MVVGGKQRRESTETSRLGNGRAFRFDCGNELLASRAAQPDRTASRDGGGWQLICRFGSFDEAMAGEASGGRERYRGHVQTGAVICVSNMGRDNRREALQSFRANCVFRSKPDKG